MWIHQGCLQIVPDHPTLWPTHSQPRDPSSSHRIHEWIHPMEGSSTNMKITITYRRKRKKQQKIITNVIAYWSTRPTAQSFECQQMNGTIHHIHHSLIRKIHINIWTQTTIADVHVDVHYYNSSYYTQSYGPSAYSWSSYFPNTNMTKPCFKTGDQIKFPGGYLVEITKINNFSGIKHYGFFGTIEELGEPTRNTCGWIPCELCDIIAK